MELIVISTPEGNAGEPEVAEQLFELGLRLFHVRKPGWNAAKLRWYIERIPRQYHSRIVLHTCHELADEYALGGLHFPEWYRLSLENGEEGGRTPAAWRTAQPALYLSSSVHELSDLADCDPSFDYVFLSPIFPGISKPGHTPVFEKRDVMDALRTTCFRRVIALGGVDVQMLAEVREMGFAGAALLGSVWVSGNPVDNFRRLHDETLRLVGQ